MQLPGASPGEMATAVVEPLEEALSSISGIDEMSSMRISEGRAQITVKFVLERDINDAANDVREKVAGAQRNLPPQILPPVIQKVDPDSDPIMAHRRVVGDDEPAHAHRDRRQAGEARASKRSTASARSISAAAARARSTSSSTSRS